MTQNLILKIMPFDIGGTSIKITVGEAAGDLIGFSAPYVPVRIPIGADGQVLTVNKARPAYMEWKDISGGTSGSAAVSYSSILMFGG